MQTTANHYAVLELRPGASMDDVKRQYRQLVLTYHPDHNPDIAEICAERLRGIVEAYEFLSDPRRKAEYDRMNGFGRSEPPRQPAFVWNPWRYKTFVPPAERIVDFAEDGAKCVNHPGVSCEYECSTCRRPFCPDCLTLRGRHPVCLTCAKRPHTFDEWQRIGWILVLSIGIAIGYLAFFLFHAGLIPRVR